MDKDKLIRRKKYFPVVIGAGILIIMILFMIAGVTHNLGLIFPLFIAFPAYAIGMGIYYEKKILGPFKEEIIKSKLVKSIPGVKYEYLPNASDIETMCRTLRIIPSATSYKFTDMITDLNYNYIYKSLDLHATHRSGGKHKHTHTDFLGKVYVVDDFNYGCEFILLDNDYFNRFTLNYFNRQNPYYNEVTINNDEFNTHYRLFSKDQNIAHDIFNLSLIMNLNKLKYKTNGKLIINYYQSKLHVFIYNQENQFEEEPDVISDYKKQIENLDSIVQILENNMDGKEAN